MTRVIWKTELPQAVNNIAIPKNAKILCVQVQNKIPCVWYLCDPEEPYEQRIFELIATGEPMFYDMVPYIGTIQMQEFVFHVFERPVTEY